MSVNESFSNFVCKTANAMTKFSQSTERVTFTSNKMIITVYHDRFEFKQSEKFKVFCHQFYAF